MLDFSQISKIKQLYASGENVMQYIKEHYAESLADAVLLSYDLQAGSYIRNLSGKDHKTLKEQVADKLSSILRKYKVSAVCEAGVGEATTLNYLLDKMHQYDYAFGFDISISRLLYAQRFLSQHNKIVNLLSADLAALPFPNDSIECIYTFHSLEPNGGNEAALLKELLRVTQRYLILIEPDYHMFSDEQRARMDQHGYIKGLKNHLDALNANVVCCEPWGIDGNPLNRASIIIVEKLAEKKANTMPGLVSPISHANLMRTNDGYFSQEDGFFFPVLNNIPVFLRQNAIFASHYGQLVEK